MIQKPEKQQKFHKDFKYDPKKKFDVSAFLKHKNRRLSASDQTDQHDFKKLAKKGKDR